MASTTKDPSPVSTTRTRMEAAVMIFWLLSVLAGPFFGYFITRVSGWVTVENWRMWMWLRIAMCVGWPLLGGVLMMTVENSRAKREGNAKAGHRGFIILALLIGFPAINAIRDLVSGPEGSRVVIERAEGYTHTGKGRSYNSFEVHFSDGTSYDVDEAVYHRAVALQHRMCDRTRLPHTDILLDVRPPILGTGL
jgi:uncharacterized membrane protein